MNTTALWALLAALLLISGCATQRQGPLYYWGDYEPLIYQMYAKPGTADPGTQVAKLSADIEKAQGKGQRVPPGEHAQLGFMEYQQGNADQAAAQFAIERQLYPESSQFMNQILKGMNKSPSQNTSNGEKP